MMIILLHFTYDLWNNLTPKIKVYPEILQPPNYLGRLRHKYLCFLTYPKCKYLRSKNRAQACPELTLKFSGSTCILSQCSSLSSAKVSLRSSMCLTAFPKEVITFLPWALTLGLPMMADSEDKLPKLSKNLWVHG